jgi:hypothetical protein
MNLSSSSVLISALALGACAETLPVEGQSCPCAPGYSCQVDDQICVESVVEERGNRPPRCTRTAPECSQREMFITDQFASAGEVSARILGRWLACEGSEGVDQEPPDFMGIEFSSDGKFYLLREVAPDQCERDYGFDHEGTWKVLDISEQNPPGTYQVDLQWAGGSRGGMVPSFSAEPLKLRTDYWGEMIGDPQ